MSKKYQNKYRIDSVRMKNYDYSQNGAYFITIVTKNRDHFFGGIVGGVETPKLGVSTNAMQLSKIGEIAQNYWNEIPRYFPFIRLDEMVVMPNHIHGILWIDKPLISVVNNDDAVGDAVSDAVDVETLHATSLPCNQKKSHKKIDNIKKNH